MRVLEGGRWQYSLLAWIFFLGIFDLLSESLLRLQARSNSPLVGDRIGHGTGILLVLVQNDCDWRQLRSSSSIMEVLATCEDTGSCSPHSQLPLTKPATPILLWILRLVGGRQTYLWGHSFGKDGKKPFRVCRSSRYSPLRCGSAIELVGKSTRSWFYMNICWVSNLVYAVRTIL